MVTYDEIRASNTRIKTELPGELVAVFPGGTNGIGEASLKQFAKHVEKPRVYFIGRAQDAGDRIAKECQEINPNGRYTFIKADLGLIKNVDRVCDEIKQKEAKINVLFMSIGSFAFGKKTEEGLHLPAALIHYSRVRFMLNLLPLLQQAESIRRVVSVFTGTKEGPVEESDWQLWSLKNPQKGRAHAASLVSMDLELMAQRAPDVSYVHNFPGAVRSGISRELPWYLRIPMNISTTLFGRMVFISPEDAGDFHTYLATSARFPAREPAGSVNQGVSLAEGQEACKGSDSKIGSGVYVVEEHGETVDSSLKTLLQLREKNVASRLWDHTQAEYDRILGKE